MEEWQLQSNTVRKAGDGADSAEVVILGTCHI